MAGAVAKAGAAEEAAVDVRPFVVGEFKTHDSKFPFGSLILGSNSNEAAAGP